MRIFTLIIIILLFSVIFRSRAQTSRVLPDKENYAEAVVAAFQEENWEEGKQILDEGLKKYPKDSDLRMLMGRYYFEKQSYDLARYELLEALEYNKNNSNAKQILINVEMASGRYSSAICYINELLEHNPYWKGLWMKKVEAYRLIGNTEEAGRLLKRLTQIYPEDDEIKSIFLYNIEEQAASKREQGELTEAINLTSLLIEKDPYNEDSYIQVINNYIRAGSADKALIYTERGLNNLPNSLPLINKKADILGEAYKYNEALIFLQTKIKETEHKEVLTRRYNAFMEDAARYHRKSDPYALYRTIYERNPKNEEAFSYVLGTAISNSYYEDALEIIKTAKEAMGETKELLVKEQNVYKLMGAQSRADQVTIKLYGLYPDDYDIKYQYTLYRHQQAKSYMAEGLYGKALDHLMFVAQNGEEDQVKDALMSIYNCDFQLRKFDEALIVLEQLIYEFPDEPDWRVKKAVIYGEQKKYEDALTEYGHVVNLSMPLDRKQVIEGYDELATVYVKKLMEDYLYIDAMRLVDMWLQINPQSEMGIRYATNISMLMKNYTDVEKYAALNSKKEEADIYPRIKLAEAKNKQNRHKESLDAISLEIADNPYHKELIGAYSQASQDYVRTLIRETEYEQSMEVLDNALAYDPDNKELKYWKGIVFEKLHQADSALYYQSFYDPSLMEVSKFKNHLKYLEYNTYKNEVGFYYLRSRYGDIDIVSSVSTIEYNRFGKNNTYTGRINYAGRDKGKGIQGQAEWNHNWRPDLYSRIDAALANKFFSSFMAGGSLYKTYKHDWESELGGGYRRTADHNNLYHIVGGIAKEWDPWWFNMRFNSFIINSKYYYNLSLQSRIYLGNPRNYVTAMGSFGSAPDVDVINNELYNGFSVTNTMVGIGVHHLIGERFSAGILGNWYNYEDNSSNLAEKEGKYRNLYTLYFQLNVRF